MSDGLFECVVKDAPSLATGRADPSAFSVHLRDSVNTFSSLGGDATLIAPSATGDYGHFAAFLRTAPAAQVDALLRSVGDAIAAWPRSANPWVSTAGLGVPWLHVRVDTRPKYYRHRPYRSV